MKAIHLFVFSFSCSIFNRFCITFTPLMLVLAGKSSVETRSAKVLSCDFWNSPDGIIVFQIGFPNECTLRNSYWSAFQLRNQRRLLKRLYPHYQRFSLHHIFTWLNTQSHHIRYYLMRRKNLNRVLFSNLSHSFS